MQHVTVLPFLTFHSSILLICMPPFFHYIWYVKLLASTTLLLTSMQQSTFFASGFFFASYYKLSFKFQIIFSWIPSHMSSEGNEKIYTLTRNTLSDPPRVSLILNPWLDIIFIPNCSLCGIVQLTITINSIRLNLNELLLPSISQSSRQCYI